MGPLVCLQRLTSRYVGICNSNSQIYHPADLRLDPPKSLSEREAPAHRCLILPILSMLRFAQYHVDISRTKKVAGLGIANPMYTLYDNAELSYL
ncbi:hypothetical protein MFRU_006g03030 [Monilinia fructicola]|nr:hypothetical protein MFRU_006g03030 [Monilinia fructicola]